MERGNQVDRCGVFGGPCVPNPKVDAEVEAVASASVGRQQALVEGAEEAASSDSAELAVSVGSESDSDGS